MSPRATPRLGFEPDYAVAPGKTLQDTLDELGMTQEQVAARSGLTPGTVNRIVQGKHRISRDTAIGLERATGVPARLWNALEMHYRERLAKQTDAPGSRRTSTG